jgi:hypothetical protein
LRQAARRTSQRDQNPIRLVGQRHIGEVECSGIATEVVVQELAIFAGRFQCAPRSQLTVSAKTGRVTASLRKPRRTTKVEGRARDAGSWAPPVVDAVVEPKSAGFRSAFGENDVDSIEAEPRFINEGWPECGTR